MNDTANERSRGIWMDLQTAAEEMGISLRQFRRIAEEENLPIIQINRKLFILRKNFEEWQRRLRPQCGQLDI